ncbi:6-pyruvoyl trahydropterin synthase family protein [Peribacillus alkalitolerans]|uniref:6-pyruvoyl trahydropterin synthase family protein n=1 Tax=Peribacillus alkalitolerans TaxID=1550385 RepID=UPI0013D2AE42|nr:6-carboxytetrahydropterin synthase [Peribacillus alkalitolerans]
MIQQIYPVVSHSYQYELNKDFHFAAAHYVPHETAGKCQQIHGHTYFANVTIAGDDLDESGFLVNFKDVKTLLHDRFDHTIMNDHHDVFNDKNPNDFPTTEVTARKMYEIIQTHLDQLPNQPKCLQIFLRETPTSYVIFRPKAAKQS